MWSMASPGPKVKMWLNYVGTRGVWRPERRCGPETSGFRGYNGPVRGPMKSYTVTPIHDCIMAYSISKHRCWCFSLPEMWLLGPQGASEKKFLRLLSLAIFYGPLINYAIIRPLISFIRMRETVYLCVTSIRMWMQLVAPDKLLQVCSVQ